MAYLSMPASLIGQFSQLIGHTKLLRTGTVAELKFPSLILVFLLDEG
jgi:hypothetical protein